MYADECDCECCNPETEDDRVLEWRERFLLCLGFTPAMSIGIAYERRIDVHELEKLVLAGCERETALNIVAPL